MGLHVKGSEKFYSQKTWFSWFNPVFAIFISLENFFLT